MWPYITASCCIYQTYQSGCLYIHMYFLPFSQVIVENVSQFSSLLWIPPLLIFSVSFILGISCFFSRIIHYSHTWFLTISTQHVFSINPLKTLSFDLFSSSYHLMSMTPIANFKNKSLIHACSNDLT